MVIGGYVKKRPIARRRIKLTTGEKIGIALWSAFCAFLVGVFFFMAWYMYNPENRMAHNLKYGRQYLANANYSKAVWEFKRVLAMDDGNAEAYQGLMEVAIRSEDTDGALSLYVDATEALSGYKEPLLRLMELRAVDRLDRGDYDGAFSVAVTVEATSGDSNEAALIRALVIDGMLADAKETGELEDALALYRQLLTVKGIDAVSVYRLMAERYVNAGEARNAVDVLEEGIAATGDEGLQALRDEYERQFAELFLPDSFIRNLNDDLAAGDFAAAADILRNKLFLYRISAYAGSLDMNGEQSFDFTPVQPADMNTSVYAEYGKGTKLLMLIFDWQRTTEREAVFNEMVWIPETDEIYALSQRQRVTEDNDLADETVVYRLEDGYLREIPSEEYYDRLSKALNGYASAGPGDIGVIGAASGFEQDGAAGQTGDVT